MPLVSLRRSSLIMSVVAIAIVYGHAAVFGIVHEADEGTPAHIFQLLIALQIPIVAFFAVSWLLRLRIPTRPDSLALLFSFGGAAVLGLAGWLGAELVNRMGVGIDDGAHLNAPSSLSGPAGHGASLRGRESSYLDH